MIIINKPHINFLVNSVKLQSHITDEKRKIDDEIWFEAESCMKDSFDAETADGFLISVLLPAVVTEQDIKVNAIVSEQLLYGINNYVLPILTKAYHTVNMPKIIVNGTHNRTYQSTAVATGCSMGVDSCSSILHHLSDICPPHFRISHLTFFNVGAMGSNCSRETELSFFKDLKMVERFAAKLSLPVVWVNSNLHALYSGFSFDASHTFRNMSVVLSMPRFFKKYFYASGFTLEDYVIDAKDFGKFEDVILSRLSSESVSLYSDDASLTRSQKINYISQYDVVKHNLYVCLKEQIKNDEKDSSDSIQNSHALNCSRCEKCLRTLLCLDILGICEQFSDIFDLDYYRRIRKLFIAKVIATKDKNLFYKDLYNLAKSHEYKLPLMSFLLAPIYRVYIMSGKHIQRQILQIVRK